MPSMCSDKGSRSSKMPIPWHWHAKRMKLDDESYDKPQAQLAVVVTGIFALWASFARASGQ